MTTFAPTKTWLQKVLTPKRSTMGWWFMVISFVVIVTNSLFLAWILAGFLSKQMIERDAIVSMDYVNSIVRVQKATDYFYGVNMSAKVPEMEEFFRHLASLPDVIRANVYGEDRTILWSSNKEMIGATFPNNDDLEIAFLGQLDPELTPVERNTKQEHANFPAHITEFIEYYLPIWAGGPTRVVGVVEIYKAPVQLLSAIKTGQRYVWLGSLGAALALYTGLAIIAWHARQLIREQEARTIEAERLAVVGEMASAVAHGLRNPLASIRSCAELVLLDDVHDDIRRPLQDIVHESDRLERWIRSFLRHVGNANGADTHPVPIDSVLTGCLEGFEPQMQARNIQMTVKCEGESPIVLAHATELAQIFNAMLSNSVEAIESDGSIHVERTLEPGGRIDINFIDDGPGFKPEILAQAFQAFATTKNSGVGVGLSLARRTVERLGGSIKLSNDDVRSGAKVTVELPAMRLTS